MEWHDTGFVLLARRHGESALIVELLTAEHGRRAGLVRGGQSPRRRAQFQPGNHVAVGWRGRLPEHLGSFECELLAAPAAHFLDDAARLSALNSATALLLAAAPEHEPHPDLYASFAELLQALAMPLSRTAGEGGSDRRSELGEGLREDLRDSAQSLSPAPHPALADASDPPSPAMRARVCPALATYVRWERALLAALGYGLDLTCCAATGTTDDLAYVSPRTGRAVSRDAGLPYRDKLLPLPEFLWHDAAATPADIVAGLRLTRHFLVHHLFAPQGGKVPDARERLAERMRRDAASGMV